MVGRVVVRVSATCARSVQEGLICRIGTWWESEKRVHYHVALIDRLLVLVIVIQMSAVQKVVVVNVSAVDVRVIIQVVVAVGLLLLTRLLDSRWVVDLLLRLVMIVWICSMALKCRVVLRHDLIACWWAKWTWLVLLLRVVALIHLLIVNYGRIEWPRLAGLTSANQVLRVVVLRLVRVGLAVQVLIVHRCILIGSLRAADHIGQ